MTFYLKYRPQKIADLDSKNVRESLQKIVDSGQIPHAFLFSGPKGTGKTSAARILAKIVNCERNDKKLGEPCNKCNQCKSITKGTNIDEVNFHQTLRDRTTQNRLLDKGGEQVGEERENIKPHSNEADPPFR